MQESTLEDPRPCVVQTKSAGLNAVHRLGGPRVLRARGTPPPHEPVFEGKMTDVIVTRCPLNQIIYIMSTSWGQALRQPGCA